MRAKARLQALGRLKTGAMNKTEAAYEQHLKLRQQAGEVLWYRFEGVKKAKGGGWDFEEF